MLTLKEFRNEFAKIPEENVIIYNFTNEVDSCCVIGHWQRLNSENPNDYSSFNCSDVYKASPLRSLSKGFTPDPEFLDLADVNNQPIGIYQQETPKQRSLALLDDMISGI